MAMRIDIDSGIVEEHVLALSRFGAHGETGVWRTVYSPEWVAAQAQVEEWCRAIGLEVRRDAVGNVWGRLEGTEGGPVVATGSHIDSQTPGGRYDGALGVIAALLAVRRLKEELGRPRRTIEVVSLCEEEASRFHTANFWGSRTITGDSSPEHLDSIRDPDGITIGEAMATVGLDPGRLLEARRDDVDVFVELHIEQGPVLEEAGVPVAVVDAISGIRHYVVELRGRADHAGARPMQGRRDALQGVAEIALGAVANALELGPPAVTTVGRMHVEPNIPAAVPEKVTFTIDARHPDAASQEELFGRHEALMERVARERDLELSWQIALDLAPCTCDPQVVGALQQAVRDQDVDALTMQSGAVHDAQRMARIARIAMVFVRSKDGRSHTPAEFTSAEDAAEGVRLLAGGLQHLVY